MIYFSQDIRYFKIKMMLYLGIILNIINGVFLIVNAIMGFFIFYPSIMPMILLPPQLAGYYIYIGVMLSIVKLANILVIYFLYKERSFIKHSRDLSQKISIFLLILVCFCPIIPIAYLVLDILQKEI